jgi:hypothetical protein
MLFFPLFIFQKKKKSFAMNLLSTSSSSCTYITKYYTVTINQKPAKGSGLFAARRPYVILFTQPHFSEINVCFLAPAFFP